MENSIQCVVKSLCYVMRVHEDESFRNEVFERLQFILEGSHTVLFKKNTNFGYAEWCIKYIKQHSSK